MSKTPFSPTMGRLLAPHSFDDFAENYFEKKHLLVRGTDPSRFLDLLDIDTVHRIISSARLMHPEVTVVNAARRVEKDEYTYETNLIDLARLYQQFADGGTLSMNNLEALHAPLANLVRALEAECNSRFQANIYLTPPNAQGFRPHYDNHCVWVLQVQGSKQWLLYDTPLELPYRNQEFNPEKTKPGAVTAEFTMHPGDLLYVPRGMMHDARTTGETSLHVTVGMLFTSWTELLAESLARVGLQDPAFRKALPLGFIRKDFDPTEAKENFKKLLARFVEMAEFEPVFEHYARDLVHTRHPVLPNQVHQVDRLAKLNLHTRCGVVPSLMYRLDVEGEQLFIDCYGGDLSLPSHVLPTLEAALTRDSFTPAELPGSLDDAGRIVLIRRLVREGMVRILDDQKSAPTPADTADPAQA